MPSRRVAVDLNAGTYYLTLTIQRWYYLFDRHNRWQILAESLRYCQEHKGLELNGFVFMLNHILERDGVCIERDGMNIL